MKRFTKMTWAAVAVLGLYSPVSTFASSPFGGMGSKGAAPRLGQSGGFNSQSSMKSTPSAGQFNANSMKSTPMTKAGGLNSQVLKTPVVNQNMGQVLGNKGSGKLGPIVQTPGAKLPAGSTPPVMKPFPGKIGPIADAGRVTPFPGTGGGKKPPVLDPIGGGLGSGGKKPPILDPIVGGIGGGKKPPVLNPFPGGKPPVIDPGNGPKPPKKPPILNPFPGGKPPVLDPGNGGKPPGGGNNPPGGGNNPPGGGNNPPGGGNNPPGGGNNPPGGGNNPPGGGKPPGHGGHGPGWGVPGWGHAGCFPGGGRLWWPNYCLSWHWPTYYAQPYCGTVYVNGSWTYVTEPVAVEQISLVQMGSSLPEIPSNATFRMQVSGLGQMQGLAAVEINGVGMQAELLEWNPDSVVVRLPAVGLTDAKISDLYILQADGSMAKNLKFKMIPALENAVAMTN